MDFGDTSSLRRLGSRLSDQASQTDALHGRINRGVAGLVSSVSTYERGAASAFMSRWGDVGAVIRQLASDSGDISRGLTILAESLDRARGEWNDAESEAWGAGFSVWPTEWSVSVSAPADAKDAAVQHAARLEGRMRAAAGDAEAARGQLHRTLARTSDRGLAELSGSGYPATYAVTGDTGLDREIDRVVGPLLAAHSTLSERA